MPQYGDLPLTILRSVSTLSGDDYHDVEDEPLREALQRRGFEPSNAAFLNVTRQLRLEHAVAFAERYASPERLHAGRSTQKAAGPGSHENEIQDFPA